MDRSSRFLLEHELVEQHGVCVRRTYAGPYRLSIRWIGDQHDPGVVGTEERVHKIAGGFCRVGHAGSSEQYTLFHQHQSRCRRWRGDTGCRRVPDRCLVALLRARADRTNGAVAGTNFQAVRESELEGIHVLLSPTFAAHVRTQARELD